MQQFDFLQIHAITAARRNVAVVGIPVGIAIGKVCGIAEPGRAPIRAYEF
jgi:uncharacterized membrane protein YccF (DUF307 family)